MKNLKFLLMIYILKNQLIFFEYLYLATLHHKCFFFNAWLPRAQLNTFWFKKIKLKFSLLKFLKRVSYRITYLKTYCLLKNDIELCFQFF
jgi:hypothetical protein